MIRTIASCMWLCNTSFVTPSIDQLFVSMVHDVFYVGIFVCVCPWLFSACAPWFSSLFICSMRVLVVLPATMLFLELFHKVLLFTSGRFFLPPLPFLETPEPYTCKFGICSLYLMVFLAAYIGLYLQNLFTQNPPTFRSLIESGNCPFLSVPGSSFPLPTPRPLCKASILGQNIDLLSCSLL